MWESNSYQAHEDHKMLIQRRKIGHDSPKTPPGSLPYQPPPPPPPAGSSGTPRAFGASGSSQLPPPPPPLSTNQSDQSTSTAAPSSSKTIHMDDDMTPDEQVQSSGDEDIGHDHIPTPIEFKHDFIVIDSPRAITFRDKYGVQMIIRFNEIHKFSDGTLHQIDEALDYRVKEFKVNRMNPGLNTRFWTRNDVDRSKEFMFAIQKRLKTRRIFQNLESFVGGRIREGDYRLLKRTEWSHHLGNQGPSRMGFGDSDGYTVDDFHPDTYTGNPVLGDSYLR
ncbi:hypothetical protein Tco_0662173 [Tanacetum coccineum]